MVLILNSPQKCDFLKSKYKIKYNKSWIISEVYLFKDSENCQVLHMKGVKKNL